MARNKNTKPAPVTGPTPIGEGGTLFDSAKVLARLDTLEKQDALLANIVEFTSSTNKFILVILFLGFLTLVVTVVYWIVQSFGSSATTEIEFIKSVNNLTNIVNHATNSAVLK
jgi:hypothetical protein